MPRTESAQGLVKAIEDLRSERQRHMDAVSEIDAVFQQLGIAASDGQTESPRRGRPGRKPGRKPGRPAGSTAAPKAAGPGRKKGKRGSFKMTANESVLGFVKAAGGQGVTGAEITKHWKSEGRGSGVYVAIGKLVKDKKLKKQENKNGRGSRYTAA